MSRICRHCGEEYTPPTKPPHNCPACGCPDWTDYWALETRDRVVVRLKQAVRDILKTSAFAGIGCDPEGHYIAMIPMMVERWLLNPDLYGEIIGVVQDIEQLEAMIYGPSGASAMKTRALGSNYNL